MCHNILMSFSVGLLENKNNVLLLGSTIYSSKQTYTTDRTHIAEDQTIGRRMYLFLLNTYRRAGKISINKVDAQGSFCIYTDIKCTTSYAIVIMKIYLKGRAPLVYFFFIKIIWWKGSSFNKIWWWCIESISITVHSIYINKEYEPHKEQSLLKFESAW